VRAGAVAAAILAVVVYANSLSNDFVYDDNAVVVANRAAHDPADWRAIFLGPSWGNDLSYRPLTVWTFAADFALHGPRPFAYHAVNVLGHAGVAAALVLLAAALGLSPLAATIAGVLFAVHPVHTEVVANVVGRGEILAAGCVLLALLVQRRVARAGWPVAGAVATAAIYGAALLAKEYSIALAALLPLADLVFTDGRDVAVFATRLRGGRLVLYGAVAGVTVAYAVLRHAALGGIVGDLDIVVRWMNPAAAAPAVARIPTALGVQALALWRLVAPFHLSADYSYAEIPLVTSIADPRAIVGGLVAAALVGTAIVLWRRSRTAFFWLSVALLTYAVVSNVFFPIGTIFAERLLYLPSAGFCVLLAMALERVGGGRTAVAVAAVAAVVWAPTTVLRNRVWHDDLTFGQALVRTAPRSAHAHCTLATTRAILGDRSAARREFGEALRIDPADRSCRYESAMNAAADLTDHEQFAAALDAADGAIAARPTRPGGYVERGLALRGLQRFDEAIAAFDEALHLDPKQPDALLDLAAVALDKQDFALAASAFERLVAVAPSQQAYRGLVYSYRNGGRALDAERIAANARGRYPGDGFFAPSP